MISLFKYLLIYILMIMTSSLIYGQYQEIILFLALGISILIMFVNKIKFTKKFIMMFNILIIMFLILYIYTNGSYTLQSMLNTLSVIFITYVYTKYIGFEFIDKYLNVIYIITIISIFGYINDITGVGDIIINKLPKFLNYIPHLKSVNGGFLYAFNKSNHIGRNSGFCIEPGKYQYFMNLALIFILYLKKTEVKKSMTKIVIFILGIITTFSAGAYIILTIILLPYIIEFKQIKLRKIVIIIICTIVVSNNFETINTRIIDKLKFDTQTYSFETGSGNTRLNDIKLDIDIFKSDIFGNGWKYYQEKWITMRIGDNYTKGSSSSSLTSTLPVYGITIFILIIMLYIRGVNIISKNNNKLRVILIFFILIQTLTQSFLLTPLLMLFWFPRNIIQLN